MIELRDYQIQAVNELLDKAITLLSSNSHRHKLVLKAPTGAGKTVIMGDWLKRMAQTLPGHFELPKRQFAYIWIAPNQLHQQSLLKLRHFFEETRELRCLEFTDLAEDSLAENDLLFFNWQSISRDDALFIRENEQGKNLTNLLAATRAREIEVIVILDEAHLFATKGDKALKVLAQIDAKLEIDVSATPAFCGAPIVEVLRQKVVAAEMIKKRVVLNPAVKDHGAGVSLDEYMLKKALAKHDELAKCYERAGSPVQPLLLIQLPNDSAKLSSDDAEKRNIIEQFLKIADITTENGKLAVWLSDSKDKINLEGIEKHDSLVQVLLFKQAIALGWDCPRASVLLIFRDMKSMTFTIQTVGRILRMPEHKHYTDDLLNYGYVYTNLSRDMIAIVQDDMDYFSEVRSLRREEYREVHLQSSYINKKLVRNRLGSKFRNALRIAAEKAGWTPLHESSEAFAINEKYLWNWQLRPGKIEVSIPKDVHFDGDREQIVRAETTRFAKTTRELNSLLHYFCLHSCGDYAPVDSAPILKYALLELLADYLGFDEFDAIKVILSQVNQVYVTELILSALKEYEDILKQHASTVSKKPESYKWEVPDVRYYDGDLHIERISPVHALQPLYVQKQESGPEKLFSAYLEEHAECIDWWYKNGDHGKDHFAVPYKNGADEWASFYVDFILKFKNGTLGFFDTKTMTGDAEASRKHNGLIDFLNELTTTRKKEHFIGGVIIKEGGVWQYCRNKLTSSFNLQGWTVFNPKDFSGVTQ
jgi:type III restriction enzyme